MISIRRKGVAILNFPKGILLVAGKTKIFHLPGGGANKWESRKRAAIRELNEETGLKSNSIKYLFNYKGKKLHERDGKLVRNDVDVFLVKSKGNPEPNNEIKRIKFWKPWRKMKIGESTLNSINKYLSEYK